MIKKEYSRADSKKICEGTIKEKINFKIVILMWKKFRINLIANALNVLHTLNINYFCVKMTISRPLT